MSKLFELLQQTSEQRRFEPCKLVVFPDGACYVEFHDRILESGKDESELIAKLSTRTVQPLPTNDRHEAAFTKLESEFHR